MLPSRTVSVAALGKPRLVPRIGGRAPEVASDFAVVPPMPTIPDGSRCFAIVNFETMRAQALPE